MNSTQKKVILTATILILLSGLFPPWRAIDTVGLRKGMVQDHYYGWIIQPANYTTGGQMFAATEVQLATDRLYAHWAMIVLVAAGAILYSRDDKRVDVGGSDRG